MDIVVITKSAKNKGYCIAGVNIINGEKVRLVTDDYDNQGAISKNDPILSKCNFEPLSIVRLDGIKYVPTCYQPENWLIDHNTDAQEINRITIDDIYDKFNNDNMDYIFYNTGERFNPNESDIDHSIQINMVYNLKFEKLPYDDGRTRTKVSFTYKDKRYLHLAMTDRNYYEAKDGEIIEKAIIVISSGNPYNDLKIYKFVSAIYPI